MGLWSFTCKYKLSQPIKNQQGAYSMFESSVLGNRDQGTAEEKLWRAVIARTLEEWVCGPLRHSRIAEQFLFNDEKDFQAVCSSAGMNPQNLRRRLHMIRARGIQKEISKLRIRRNKKTSFQPSGIWGQNAIGV
jgi:hypothetical protein